MKWKLGNIGGTVVSEEAIGDIIQPTDSIRYYGGHLIAESIPSPEIANIIKAAPRLLSVAKSCEIGLTGHGSIAAMITLLHGAIEEAEGRAP